MHNSTIQVSHDVVQLCSAHGIRDVIITPGSRNAPLAMAFQKATGITCWSLVDERSAAFFALGMAQGYQRPVALCCTSGTALLNYYPAVAEAFYQGLPLLVLSADRPLEKIDQQIGQSIRQAHSLNLHVKKSIQLVETANDSSLIAFNQRQINEALLALTHGSPGPVHLNIPLREPLYEEENHALPHPRVIQRSVVSTQMGEEAWQVLLGEWEEVSQVLILVGMYPYIPHLSQALEQFAESSTAVVLADWVSGLSGKLVFHDIDRTLAGINMQAEAFQPDLVISYGHGVVSKHIKRFLTQFPPKYHWFIQEDGKIIDTYENLTRVIPTTAESFFPELVQRVQLTSSSFAEQWKAAHKKVEALHEELIPSIPFSDLNVFAHIHTHLPKGWALHLGNSSVIRYMQLFSKPAYLHDCFGNRGTSGIDGSTSTAIGYAVASQRPTVLISGDISFFYDNNAWWNTYVPPHFRAIVIHNGGGGIFRLIDGPEKGGILENFQETPHGQSAEKLAHAHGVGYQVAYNEEQFSRALETFFLPSEKARILEVFTPRYENAQVWHSYLERIKAVKQ